MNELAPKTTPALHSTWHARLRVELVRTPEGTRLGHRSHCGPLRIQRPFFPEGGDVLHLYVLHPPGGVVGGDHLDVRIDATADSRALLTTPAAQKIYRSSGAMSLIRSELHVAAGASLEWLPAETIVYGGANARSQLNIHLEPGATFVGWEMTCLGRPASSSPFDAGHFETGIDVTIDARLELSEKLRFLGGSTVMRAPFGLAGNVCLGTLLCVAAERAALDQSAGILRELATSESGVSAGVTSLDGLVVFRVQGISAQAVHRLLVRCWKATRPYLLGHTAHEPRIWST